MLETVPDTTRRAIRARTRPPISPRSVPAAPTARPSTAKAVKIEARDVPSDRSVAISGRRRRTEIETAFATRNIPTRSVSEPSAFRLKRNALAIRPAASATRPAGSTERPAGNRRAISLRAASAETPGSRTTSTRSTKPVFPRSRPAVKRSVTRTSPPAARASPESSSRPPTTTRVRTPPATSGTGDPIRKPWRDAKETGSKTVPEVRSFARSAPAVGAVVRPQDGDDLPGSVGEDGASGNERRERTDPPQETQTLDRVDRHASRSDHDQVALSRHLLGRLAKRLGDASVGVMDRGDRGDADRNADDGQESADRATPSGSDDEGREDESKAGHEKRPSRNSTMRSARRAAAGEWVARRSVTPRSRRTWSRSSRTSSPWRESRFPVGSSARSRRAPVTRPRAIAALCISP